MIKLANRVKPFFHKHFVKHEVHWVQSTLIVHYELDGRKILQIARTMTTFMRLMVYPRKKRTIRHLWQRSLMKIFFNC